MYGVKKDLLGLLEGRETYVIGKDGVVKLVRFRLRMSYPVHEKLFSILESLQPRPAEHNLCKHSAITLVQQGIHKGLAGSYRDPINSIQTKVGQTFQKTGASVLPDHCMGTEAKGGSAGVQQPVWP